jgi:hypothetical protein
MLAELSSALPSAAAIKDLEGFLLGGFWSRFCWLFYLRLACGAARAPEADPFAAAGSSWETPGYPTLACLAIWALAGLYGCSLSLG